MPNLFPIMIDSGAYSAFTHESTIDLDSYIAFCHAVKKDFPQAVFVNLDVMGRAGKWSYKNWLYMRSQGIDALPVYHLGPAEGKGPDDTILEKYLERTDHIGLGAIAKVSTPQRKVALDRVWENYLIDKSTRMPKVKVHAMGVTSFPLMLRYPWHSVDSTGWIQVGQFGHILVAKRRNGSWDYTAMPTKIGFSTKGGQKDQKGKHFTTLSEHERQNLLRYLREKGFQLGWDVPCTTGGRAVLKGVSTWHGQRCEISLDFYAEFLRQLPWPRPFIKGRHGGFGL